MKTPTLILAAALALSIASLGVEAKRFGGGGNLGKQRAVPMKEAPKSAPAAPADASKPAPAAPAATPATPAAQPSFMSRWGGMIAGLGIGALLGSMFSGNFGGGMGILLMLLLAGGVAFFVMRMLASRAKPPVPGKPVAFAGIGQNLAAPPPIDLAANSAAAVEAAAPNVPADFPADAFLRQAKMAFIRLQAANDTRDLDDIRDYTTPEMYAEIAMQIEERGAAPQKTEVVNVHPTLLEVVEEGGFQIASVRFAGLIRENDKSNPESFDEVWHVRKRIGDTSAHWLIAGIQQLPEPLAA